MLRFEKKTAETDGFFNIFLSFILIILIMYVDNPFLIGRPAVLDWSARLFTILKCFKKPDSVTWVQNVFECTMKNRYWKYALEGILGLLIRTACVQKWQYDLGIGTRYVCMCGSMPDQISKIPFFGFLNRLVVESSFFSGKSVSVCMHSIFKPKIRKSHPAMLAEWELRCKNDGKIKSFKNKENKPMRLLWFF